jgi:hypothetical protein
MLPQANLFVAAPLRKDREAELRGLLASMNLVPGFVNPTNPLVPFAQFDRLHYARFVILNDASLEDIHTAYGLPLRDYPTMLAFVADFDGDADSFRAQLASRARDGLQRIFSCCEGFNLDTDLARWMKDHEQPPAAAYVNWVGNSVRRVREGDALRFALEMHLQNNASAFCGKDPSEVRKLLKDFVNSEKAAGRLKLSEEEPTPLGWKLRKLVNVIGVPLVLVLLSPMFLIYTPIFLIQLRSREKRDMEIAPRPDVIHEKNLARLEDHNVTNQFSAIGSLKPGLFRRWTTSFLLWAVNYTTHHIYNRGQLSRVPTIHFARWVFLNDRKRIFFASNYDGSLDSYMDDFINKVGWGLNLVFSNGIGYPRTSWLLFGGSKNEQKFKYFLRCHQLPTEVWYNAYPGLSAFDLKRNLLIREGIERDDLSEIEIRRWVALF